MSPGKPPNRALAKLLFAAILVVICVLIANWLNQQSKPWVIPEEYQALHNPLPATATNLESARQLYRDDCAQCHGQSGKGDGPEAWMHRPAPADLTDRARMAKVSDGAVFYQITQGRRPMPAFKNRMTADQRWQLVLLLRSFSPPATPNN